MGVTPPVALPEVAIMERQKRIEIPMEIRLCLKQAKVKYPMKKTKGSSALSMTNFSWTFSRKFFIAISLANVFCTFIDLTFWVFTPDYYDILCLFEVFYGNLLFFIGWMII